MTQVDEFLANAARMERMSRNAHTDAERQVYAGFARTWRRLAEDTRTGVAPRAEPVPPEPHPDRYMTHAQEMEHLARVARTGEERELFLDLAARWRQLAEEAQVRVLGGWREDRPRH